MWVLIQAVPYRRCKKMVLGSPLAEDGIIKGSARKINEGTM